MNFFILLNKLIVYSSSFQTVTKVISELTRLFTFVALDKQINVDNIPLSYHTINLSTQRHF